MSTLRRVCCFHYKVRGNLCGNFQVLIQGQAEERTHIAKLIGSLFKILIQVHETLKNLRPHRCTVTEYGSDRAMNKKS